MAAFGSVSLSIAGQTEPAALVTLASCAARFHFGTAGHTLCPGASALGSACAWIMAPAGAGTLAETSEGPRSAGPDKPLASSDQQKGSGGRETPQT